VVTDPAPNIGEHTDEILKTYLSYTDVEISELRKKQVIF